VHEVEKIEGMTDDKLRHVLGANALSFFGLNPDDLRRREASRG